MIAIAIAIMFSISAVSGNSCSYASGSTKAGAEKLSLDTWYIDSTIERHNAYFKFTASSSSSSKYIVLFVPIEKTIDGELVSAVVSSADGRTMSLDSLSKIPARKTETFKLYPYVFDEDGDSDTREVRYKIMVKEIKSSVTSTDGASSLSGARTVKCGTWYKAKTTAGKADYYKFTTSSRSASKYTIFMMNMNSDDSTFDASIYKLKSGENWSYVSSAEKHTPQSWDGEEWIGEQEEYTYYWFNPITKNTTKKFKIESYIDDYQCGDSEEFGGNYRFMVLEMPNMPSKSSIKSLTAGKGKLTVKYYKRTPNTRYQIAYKKSSSSAWKYTTSTSESKTISKLKKGVKYNVKVRAQRNVSGKYHSGEWSKVKSVTVK